MIDQLREHEVRIGFGRGQPLYRNDLDRIANFQRGIGRVGAQDRLGKVHILHACTHGLDSGGHVGRTDRT